MLPTSRLPTDPSTQTAPWLPPATGAPRAPSRLRAAVAVVAVAAALGVGAFLVGLRATAVTDADRAAHLPAPPMAAATARAPLSLPAVAAAALSRVVTVEVDTDRGERFGTGWLFDATGDVVTNNHVVERARAVRLVERSGSVHTASVVGYDAAQDIAVVRSGDGLAGIPLPLAAGPAAVGQPVVVLASGRATMHGDTTLETVTRLHDSITVNPEPGQPGGGDVQYTDMLVLSGAVIYQGNSGGPVLDATGTVAAVVTATSADQPESYAIPIGRVTDELRAFAGRSTPAA